MEGQRQQHQILLLGLTMALLYVSRAQDPSQLSLDYYLKTCPDAQKIVRTEMECAVKEDPRNAAAILRLHFHDCFVQGCDGSVLLDDTITLKGEKEAAQNANSLIGFDLIDRIKTQLESLCPGTVSCADLLAIAARDATLLGKLKETCPVSGGDDNITAMDYVTPYIFDNTFYQSLTKGDGLLNSDQEMYSSLIGFVTADLVKTYAWDPLAFFKQFSDSMVKMGNITNPEGGEVRTNCRFVNT